jgi:hypothetical protein
MEIRGKSSVPGPRADLETGPNQPLFILDGFESTLAAITILKDAASTREKSRLLPWWAMEPALAWRFRGWERVS